MPCDTVQLNELNMQALDLETLAKSLEKNGWRNVMVDKKRKRVTAYGMAYEQSSGQLVIRSDAEYDYPGWWGDDVESNIKRGYVWETIKSRAANLGWEFYSYKDAATGKSKTKLRKKAGYAKSAFESGFGSDKSGGFTGFSWGKH